jgi:hypothetical protein
LRRLRCRHIAAKLEVALQVMVHQRGDGCDLF